MVTPDLGLLSHEYCNPLGIPLVGRRPASGSSVLNIFLGSFNYTFWKRGSARCEGMCEYPGGGCDVHHNLTSAPTHFF